MNITYLKNYTRREVWMNYRPGIEEDDNLIPVHWNDTDECKILNTEDNPIPKEYKELHEPQTREFVYIQTRIDTKHSGALLIVK